MSKQNREMKNGGVGGYLTYHQLKTEKKSKKNRRNGAANVDIKPIVYDAKLKIYDNFVTKNGLPKIELIVYKNSRSVDIDNCRLGGNSSKHMTDEELKKSRENHVFEVQRKLKDYAMNNDFNYFWTLTFDPKKCGKSDELRFEDMRKWLKNQRNNANYRNEDFRYIFVPEYHTGKGENGGTVHWHGISGGYTPNLTDSGHEFNGVKVFNCDNWKYGFSNVQQVRSKGRVANYIKKYITKDLINSPVRAHKKKYWSSKNLKLPDTYYIHKMPNLGNEWTADYENDVCSIFDLTGHDIKKLKKEFGNTEI